VNNNYEGWGMYAIGGSAQPIINSEGNRFVAPNGGNMKEVCTFF
jgi:pectate lyase